MTEPEQSAEDVVRGARAARIDRILENATTPPQYPTCPTCGHAARHVQTNVEHCDECGGPCVTEEGWRTFGIDRPWPGREPGERETRNDREQRS